MRRTCRLLLTSAFLLSIQEAVASESDSKTVFITKGSTNGEIGGLSAADSMCQAEAEDPESIVPSGTYLAWLSDGVESPASRFEKSPLPYVLPDGTEVARSYDDLIDGTLDHPLNVDSTGTNLGILGFWTGTLNDGTSASSIVICQGWGLEQIGKTTGMVGRTNATENWSSYVGRTRCTNRFRLACFQQ